MEEMAQYLEQVKINLPVNCTQTGLMKLYAAFLEYKCLLNLLPETMQQVKKKSEDNLAFLEFKIQTITDSSNSNKDARYCFKEAVSILQDEIDKIIRSISAAGMEKV